jgi:hypothetical protein
MRHIGIISLATCLAVTTGCHYCFFSKCASEQRCPTDIRQTHCWCFGEDALFHYPCGPKKEFYGHEETSWREWPADGSTWGSVPCGAPVCPELPFSDELIYAADDPGVESIPGPQPFGPGFSHRSATNPRQETPVAPIVSPPNEPAPPRESPPGHSSQRRQAFEPRVEMGSTAEPLGIHQRPPMAKVQRPHPTPAIMAIAPTEPIQVSNTQHEMSNPYLQPVEPHGQPTGKVELPHSRQRLPIAKVQPSSPPASRKVPTGGARRRPLLEEEVPPEEVDRRIQASLQVEQLQEGAATR